MNDEFPQRIPLADAEAILDRATAAARLPVERAPLAGSAGRILAEDLAASVPLPAFDNSAMDGYALRSADAAPGAQLACIGEQFAGVDRGLRVDAGQCVRITTGAPMPAGADAVLIRENAVGEGATIRVAGDVRPGQHLRRRGEDVQLGDIVLRTGEEITPARASLAAALGAHDLVSSRRPTVAVFTTGDELVPPGRALAPGQVYDSNRVLLQTLLQGDGLQPVAWPHLPDDPGVLGAALRDAAFSFDVILTCGGVSAGERDFLPALLREHGQILFWRVQLRPGMPVLFGRLGSAWLLGLPGNPVSVYATYLTLGRRLLDGLQGRREARARWSARLTAPVRKRHARREFLRGNLECDAQGQLRVRPNPADGSHRLRAAADADALIVLPEGEGDWAAGDAVEVLPLRLG